MRSTRSRHAKSNGREGEKRSLAKRALDRVLPEEARASLRSIPRAGSLKSAVLVVLSASRRPLTTKEVGSRIEDLSWAPSWCGLRRLATVLGELRRDKLVASGPHAARTPGESGPLQRKTWMRRKSA